MATNEQIGLLVTLFFPLLAGLFVLAFCRTERAIKIWSIRFSLVPLIVSAALLFAYDRTLGGIQFEIEAPWIPVLNSNFHLGADGLSMPLIFLTTLLSTLSIFYSARTIRTRVREYFIMFHLLELSMLGVFVALDYVLFYLFWEVSLVPMYLLIGIWGGQNRSYASIKFFIYTLVGSVAMLLAILLTYFATGTFDIPGAAQAQAFAQLDDSTRMLLSSLAFWGFFLGFAFKVPSFPFHTWLPDAHTEAPTAGSVILAGVLLKLGAYGFLRIILPTYPEASQFWAPAVIAVGAIAIVYGAFVCVAQGDLKRLIAYSSVSHMGYVMLGIGAASLVLTPEGLEQVAAKFGGVAAADVYDSAAMALNGAALPMDRVSAKTLLYDGAVYLHGGERYRVERLDLEEGTCAVARSTAGYFTEAVVRTDIRLLHWDEETRAACRLALGDILVRTQPTVFRKIRYHTHERIGRGGIDLPADEMHTRAAVILFGGDTAAGRSFRALADRQRHSALTRLGHLIRNVAPVFLLCDVRDLGVAQRVRDPDLGAPALYLYDACPGGSGLAEGFRDDAGRILSGCRDLVAGCACARGCPSPSPESGSPVAP